MRFPARSLALAVLVLVAAALPSRAQTPLGTAFSYQGQLRMSGIPYSGSADFVFRLYDASSGGNQLGGDVSLTGIPVAGGLFTTLLDFGSVFDGNACWLECDVMTPGDGGFTTLAPRQLLAPAPYALRALNGPAASSQWSNSPSGIDYAGSVAIGGTASSGFKLWINGGTANLNPLYVTNSSANFAALGIRNDAAGGYGIYDGFSDRHYLEGFLGLGTTTPTHPLEISTTSYGSPGIRVSAVGARIPSEYQAAVIALGYSGTPGLTTPSMGVYASSEDTRAVWGISVNDLGVVGDCQTSGTSGWLGGLNEGVYGQATSANRFGGYFKNTVANGVALRADGMAQVKSLQLLGADLAESFPVREGEVEPGTVLMLDDGMNGRLRVSDHAYSTRVAGVVSGANGLGAAVVLSGASYQNEGHATVALSGRVWVKCDATASPIRVGDLLTTSARAGHAMRAEDRDRAYGATLGKAMTSLERGTGMVLVLVSLQ